MANTKKIKLKNLFNNNKFTLAFSFVVAFVIWISVAMVFSPQTQRVIEDVPVKIVTENSVPEKFGLRLFGQTEFTVDVTITGKRYVVGSKNVNADSIEVVAQTGYVDSAGKKRLQLKASLVDTTADYIIESVSEEYIEAYFDEYKEAKFPIQLKLDYDGGNVIPENYVQGDVITTINSETVREVKITGAAQQINSIENVFAYVDLKKPLTETTVLDAEIIPTDEFGTTLKYIQINGEDNPKATVTIPVLKIQDLTTDVDFSGVPTAYSSNQLVVGISPETMKVAMPEDDLKDRTSYTITQIPFSSLAAKQNVFTFSKAEIENSKLKILDEVENFTVTVDLSYMASKTIELSTSDIQLLNQNTGKNVSIKSDYVTVEVIGPEDSLELITEEDILAQVNLSNVILKDGVNEVELKLSLNDSNNCWVYGTYKIEIIAAK